MNIISPDEWTPCDGVVLEAAADKAVRSGSHVLVIAGPGAGKTELLAQKAAYLLQTNQCRDPQRILAISFKKDAAQNLKERVEQRCGAEAGGRFISMTYDNYSVTLRFTISALRGRQRPATLASCAICDGVVPQHPPTIFTAPERHNRSISLAKRCGDNGGSPAAG